MPTVQPGEEPYKPATGDSGNPPLPPREKLRARRLLDPETLEAALRNAFVKLNPLKLVKNPVVFTVELGAALVTALLARDLFVEATANIAFQVQISIWLWLTVFFANFAEALAEARRNAQADTLRKTKPDATAKRLLPNGRTEAVIASKLRSGDVVLAEVGDLIQGDGEIIHGIATVDESMITGESAPVIREPEGDRSAVTPGSRILTGVVKILMTSTPAETFVDRMVALVEGADRQKAPNEIALSIVLGGLTLVYLIAIATLHPFAAYAVHLSGEGAVPTVMILVAFLACLVPTSIGGLLSAIGISGVERVMQQNVLSKSGKAVEMAGDINTLLLDKTGTITSGNREAAEFIIFPGVTEDEMARAAHLSSHADDTPEGLSIRMLAENKYGVQKTDSLDDLANVIPFSAYTRMSGVDFDGRKLRKGASGAIAQFVEELGGWLPESYHEISDRISRSGGTPLGVADGPRALGLIYLKDVLKTGIKARIAQLRTTGIRSVMITGDNPLTAAAIAGEAAVEDFLAQATPADKLEYIKREQAEKRLVAMTGDGTNDAPALAQADVGLVMNSGTLAAKEAGNMVDLDSDPTKLIEVVAIGKQLLNTRRALTTVSIANDVAICLAIVPAMLMRTYPALRRFDLLNLSTPESAVLAALAFNALMIVALLPLALQGFQYRPADKALLIRRNLFLYALGGLIIPFPAIWLIGHLLEMLHLA